MARQFNSEGGPPAPSPQKTTASAAFRPVADFSLVANFTLCPFTVINLSCDSPDLGWSQGPPTQPLWAGRRKEATLIQVLVLVFFNILMLGNLCLISLRAMLTMIAAKFHGHIPRSIQDYLLGDFTGTLC